MLGHGLGVSGVKAHVELLLLLVGLLAWLTDGEKELTEKRAYGGDLLMRNNLCMRERERESTAEPVRRCSEVTVRSGDASGVGLSGCNSRAHPWPECGHHPFDRKSPLSLCNNVRLGSKVFLV